MTKFNFKTREEYLAWRQEWKEKYAHISEGIRNARRARKKYTWQYRAKGDTTSKRRTKIGTNPYYDPNAQYRLQLLKGAATAHLEQLAKAKKVAAKQREERLMEEELMVA